MTKGNLRRFDITIEDDGQTYHGSCTEQGSMVTVSYLGGVPKSAHLSGSTPEQIAEMLLSELVEEQRLKLPRS